MVVMPNYEDYDINVLILLGNRTNDMFTRNEIKLSIVKKILGLDKPMFFLVNKFMNSDKILKEAYADTIMIYMKNNDYPIPEDLVDEILRFASLDGLMYYGADSNSFKFSMKCKAEFDSRAKMIEDKIELNKKRNMDKIKIRNMFERKK